MTRTSFYAAAHGRNRWVINETSVGWKPEETAFIIVDMWNQHFCPTATMYVGQLAVPINNTVTVARQLGAHIIWAPSDVTAYYANSAARRNTMALPNETVPTERPLHMPPPPLNSSDPCDVPATIARPQTRQVRVQARSTPHYPQLDPRITPRHATPHHSRSVDFVAFDTHTPPQSWTLECTAFVTQRSILEVYILAALSAWNLVYHWWCEEHGARGGRCSRSNCM